MMAKTDRPVAGNSLTRRDFMQRAAIFAGSAGALAGAADGTPKTVVPLSRGSQGVRFIHASIPMSDGIKIAACIWMPEGSATHPVPALLEYSPYHSSQVAAWTPKYPHFLASHGYACVVADIRGSGDSDGPVQDEYVKQEQDDGVAIIAWIAKQRWCSGKVGMYGLSWSGFSALQVAARNPPELKAVITHCSSDDRYTDDAHYLGGCLAQDMFTWGSLWTTICARAPNPAVVGARWRDMWMQRLNSQEFYVGNWLSHQHRDTFWKHASVDENYGSIKCAVYAVGGWVDGYNCVVPRLLANLKCPRKGLVGPWGHDYPDNRDVGRPGPAIDWENESLRWWDYWLKGVETGIMREPSYRVWMQHEEATRGVTDVPGRWVAEDSWPSARIESRRYFLTGKGIENGIGVEVVKNLTSLQTTGITAPNWVAFNMDTELPTDQRVDDARSLVFDSAPLQENLEILGAPVVTLELSVDKPVAFLVVRLNEVKPDGASSRVTYAILNLTHRDSHEFPTPLEPTKRYRVRVVLRDRAHRFKKGSRIRVAVSTTAWPLIWPSPGPVALSCYTGVSELELPIRAPQPEDDQLTPFTTVVGMNSSSLTQDSARPAIYTWDVAAQKLRITTHSVGGDAVLEINDNDPTSAKGDFHCSLEYKHPVAENDERTLRNEGSLNLSLTNDALVLRGSMKAFEDEREVFARSWERTIPRQLL
jgi:uncharacterized protein